ncbi:hypothetical protein ABT025_18370 [Streptomyces sp. NPDC002809]|uniref:hypothetical protein n=1 Tax=Streptomyces sp. NPDC002809 TaxID=3154433 RepID=UPI00332D41B5
MISFIGNGLGIAMAGTLGVGWLLILILGNTVWRDSDETPADAPPTSTPKTAFTWTISEEACTGEWPSASAEVHATCGLGGGDPVIYESNYGGFKTNCGPKLQPTTFPQVDRLADSEGNVVCKTAQ